MIIYSLKTGKYITKIYYKNLKDITELKNNDLIICIIFNFYIYRLLNENYELYQIINEFEQGTNIIKNFNGRDKKDYNKLNTIYELMNGNLVSCNSYWLKTHKK